MLGTKDSEDSKRMTDNTSHLRKNVFRLPHSLSRMLLLLALSEVLVLAQLPVAPQILSPGTPSEPSEALTSTTPTLFWRAVSGATLYAIAVREYPYGNANVKVGEFISASATSFAIPANKKRMSNTLTPRSPKEWSLR